VQHRLDRRHPFQTLAAAFSCDEIEHKPAAGGYA